MPHISIPGFKGGIATSLYDSLSKQTYQTAKDLDVFTSPNVLIPNYSIANDATTDTTLNNIKLHAYIKGSDGRNYFKGFDNSAGTTLTIWDGGSAALGSTTNLDAETTAAGDAGTHGMVEFLSYLWYFQSSTKIQNFNFTTIDDDVVSGGNVSSQAPIFVHQGLGKMFYTTSAYQIGSTADITPTNTAVITFDNALRVVQMAEYGRYVAVGLNHVNGASSSKIAIWDGSASTVDDMIDLGDIGIQSVVNVNGSIHVLTSTNPFGWGTKNLIRIYKIIGSQVKLMKELDLKATGTGLVTINTQAVAVLNGKIYFGMNTSTTASRMTIDNGVYAYDTEQDLLTLDRITSDTTAIDITSIGFNGGAMVVTWYDGTDYKFSHVLSSPSVSSLGVYESNIFRFDPTFKGRVKNIQIRHKELPASTGFTVKVKEIGKYTDDGTPPSAPSFATAFTQTTANTTRTTVKSINGTSFNWCDAFQIQITFDTISGITAPEIIFPITIEFEINEQVLR